MPTTRSCRCAAPKPSRPTWCRKGIEKNRVYTEGKGEKQPVADNKTAEGRAKNRRVEIEVVGTRAKQVSRPRGIARKAPLRRGFFRLRPRCARTIRRYHRRMTVNADPHELAKFSELAHRWWDPDSEFRPLHEINPLRLDWIDAPRAAGRQARARRRLRRRHPGRSDGAAGAEVLGIDLADQAAARWRSCTRWRRARRTSSTARSAPRRWPPSSRAASTSSPAWRCSSTCPIRPRSCAACAALVKPGGWVFFSTINRNPKAFLFAIVGAEYVLQAAAARARTSTRKFIRPSELAALVPRRRPRAAATRGHGLQPADAALLAVRRHQRQLPGRLPQAGMTRAERASGAVLFDLDGTLIDSAPDLAGAGNEMRADARPARRCRYERCGPMVGAGARGMVGVAFGIAPERRRLRRAARRVPRAATKRA